MWPAKVCAFAAFKASAQVNMDAVPVQRPLLSVWPTKQRIHISFVWGASTVPSARTLNEDVGVLMGTDVFCTLMQVAWAFCSSIPRSEQHAIFVVVMDS